MAKQTKIDFLKEIRTLDVKDWWSFHHSCKDQGIVIDLSGADLSGMNLVGYELSGVKLENANLTCTDLTKASFARANLRGVDLSIAKLKDTNFENADLEGANLRDVRLGGSACTSFRGASLKKADLRGVDFNKGTFGTCVVNANFDDCIVDASTKIPPPPMDHFATLREMVEAAQAPGPHTRHARESRSQRRR